ncbi:MAG: sporulation protein [Acidobacteriota bacterium]|jgi:hypothetical protein
MSFVSFVKRILNIGGPQIDLVTQDSEYFPSEWIRGELLITAPEYRQKIKSIAINLEDFWNESVMSGIRATRASRYHRHDSITIVNDFVFLPMVKYQFPFEVQLPANCRVSSVESGWRLDVIISTFGSPISRAAFNIDVQLSKVLQQIIEAIETDTKLVEVPRGRKYIPENSATRFVFMPIEHLQSVLQYLMLDVSLTEEGGIKGNILFNMSESGSLGLLTKDTDGNYSHEYQIDPTQLFDSNGQIERKNITNVLSDKLMEVLAGKNH